MFGLGTFGSVVSGLFTALIVIAALALTALVVLMPYFIYRIRAHAQAIEAEAKESNRLLRSIKENYYQSTP